MMTKGKGETDTMANNTVWNPIQTIPIGKLVVVFNHFRGYALRSAMDKYDMYDENCDLDDSETEWDLWAELPEKPGKKNNDK